MIMKSPRPALRIFDNKLAKSFYLDWLAFRVNWEHHPEDGEPSIIKISRDEATLCLSEHYGDGLPGAKVFIEVDDIDALHRELTDRKNSYMKPGIETMDWGRTLTVTDPFGNKLVFVHSETSTDEEGRRM